MKRFPSRGASPAFAKSAVAFVGATNFKAAVVYNSGGSTIYLQVFDANALPANNTVPLMVVQVPSKATGSLDWGYNFVPMVNGVVIAMSSTDTVLTLISGNDALIQAIAD